MAKKKAPKMSPEEIRAANKEELPSLVEETKDPAQSDLEEFIEDAVEENPEKLSTAIQMIYEMDEYKTIISKGPFHESFKILIKRIKETERTLGI